MRSIKKSSSKKRILILSLLILLSCISIGYAYLNQKVNISSVAKIEKNTWDIHFENIVVGDNNADNTVPFISNNNTKINITLNLKKPGDSYEFLVDVVNNGTIDAKIESVFKTTLSEEQLKYLDYSLTYMDGVAINKNDLLKVGEKDQIRLKINFKNMTDPSYIPTTDQIVNIEGEILFVQDLGDGVPRKRKLYYVMESTARGDETLNFLRTASDTNGKGVYRLTKIATSSPIYYYRGEVYDNNVLFGNFCWKIIRTTNTGGIKLIYNGKPNDGICNNTHSSTEIAKSAFNVDGVNDPKYAGYMYDDNTVDSTIKGVIDTWFSNNLVDYLSYLEDTPFYNERDYVMLSSTYMQFASAVRYYEGAAIIRLGAAEKSDIFTISSSIGNGALTYPVGLITSDEAMMAGAEGWNSENNEHENLKVYLNTYEWFWTMTPWICENTLVMDSFLGAGNHGGSAATSEFGVRPVVSLRPGILYSSGNGTNNSPYIITSN